jgi:hypothetical protein
MSQSIKKAGVTTGFYLVIRMAISAVWVSCKIGASSPG